MGTNNYKKLLLMLAVSFVIMYTIMFLNVDNSSDVFLSLTRLYISLLIVSPMAVMLLPLSEKIIKSQKEEISQMKEILRLEK